MCVQKPQPAVAPHSEQHAAGVEECPRLRSWPLKSVPAKVLQPAALELEMEMEMELEFELELEMELELERAPERALELPLTAAPAANNDRRTSICRRNAPNRRFFPPPFSRWIAVDRSARPAPTSFRGQVTPVAAPPVLLRVGFQSGEGINREGELNRC